MTKEGKAETRQTQGRDKEEASKGEQLRSGKNNDWEKRSNPWSSETGFFSSDIARRIAGSLEKQETTARGTEFNLVLNLIYDQSTTAQKFTSAEPGQFI